MSNTHRAVPGKRGGIGSHTNPGGGATDEWLTPRFILEALGPFDLDPCAPIERPWPIAAKHLTIEDDGLAQPWDGFVWCNPPYGAATYRWLSRLADHGRGIALVFARTETKGFMAQAWERATAMLFLTGRLTFCRPNGQPARVEGGGNSGGPSVLIAYGLEALHRLEAAGLEGALVENWRMVGMAQRLRVRERL